MWFRSYWPFYKSIIATALLSFTKMWVEMGALPPSTPNPKLFKTLKYNLNNQHIEEFSEPVHSNCHERIICGSTVALGLIVLRGYNSWSVQSANASVCHIVFLTPWWHRRQGRSQGWGPAVAPALSHDQGGSFWGLHCLTVWPLTSNGLCASLKTALECPLFCFHASLCLFITSLSFLIKCFHILFSPVRSFSSLCLWIAS